MKSAAVVSVCVLLRAGLAAADATAIAPGRVRAPSGGDLKAGPGAVCAHAEVSRQVDPAMGGQKCDDTDASKIGIVGGIQETILKPLQVHEIGQGLSRAQGLMAPMGLGLPAGRSLEYARTERNDKIGDAKMMGGSLLLEVSAEKVINNSKATANAKQTIETPIAAQAKVSGLATASVMAGGPPARSVFGVGVVNDPILLELSSLSSGLIEVHIGDGPDLLKLAATDTGDFAFALYELSLDSSTLLSMKIGMDFTTTSLDDLDLAFAAYDPLAFGFPDPLTFFDTRIKPYLNPIESHQLTAIGEIPLFSFTLGSTPRLLTYNYVAVAGSYVPEPGSMTLLGLGLGALGLAQRRRRSS